MTDDVAATVRASLLEHRMVEPGDTVVVAVSGGPDSLCLLHVLRARSGELGIALHVAHLDHMLRGAESAGEAEFVAATARAWGLPITATAKDVRALATSARANLHQAARTARYQFLSDVAQACGARAVAVAHNADDQAETVLMHLLRGAGPAGLRGMRPITDFGFTLLGYPILDFGLANGDPNLKSKIRNLKLIRPLLRVPRAAIEAYCAAHRLQPRRDSTNQDRSATRNRIRHELLPRLIEYNPNIVEALGRTAALCADEHDLAQQALAAAWPALARERTGAVDFDGDAWRALHPALQRAALRHAYALLGGQDTLDLAHVEVARATAARGVGGRVELPGGIALHVDYGGAFTVGAARELLAPQLADDAVELPVPGRAALVRGWAIEAAVRAAPTADAAPAAERGAELDAETITGPLVVRRRQPGDRYRPAGGRGSRRLQDMFVDAKIPRALRAAWPVVAAGEAIVWAPGLRPAAEFAAKPTTKRSLWLRIMEPAGENQELHDLVTSGSMMGRDMDNDIAKILISSDEIQAKVGEMGERIARDYAPLGDLLLVGVLKGCMMFMVDLARAIPMSLAIDFIATSSYGHSTESSGVVRLLKDLDTDIAGRHVLIVEDIIDSGLTLAYLHDQLGRRNPASLRICALLNKPERREADVPIDYLGFDIPNEFVVGYGLDFGERYRNLSYIGVLKEEVYTREA